MGKLGARAVDKRMRFVTAAEASEETMTALCRRFGLSRKTGYKWLERYRLEGIEGLSERSRAPHAHPRAVSAAIAERCLAVRQAHRSWGPVKVRSRCGPGSSATIPPRHGRRRARSGSCSTAKD